jgi:autotransporter-associated beta strand protein
MGAVTGSAESTRADATWVPTAAGTTYSWTVNSNWSPAVFPNSAGEVVNLNNDIAGNQNIGISSAITLGTLNIGDASGGSNFTVEGPAALTLQSASPGGPVAINVTAAGTSANTVNAPINLTGPLTITGGAGGQTFATGGTFNADSHNIVLVGGATNRNIWGITGQLNGNGTITYDGLGGSVVTGTKNFTGTIILNRGISASSNGGTMVVTSGSVKNASEIIINGAITIGTTQLGGILHAGNSADAAANPGQRISQNTITLNSGSLSPVGQRAAVNASGTNWQKGLEFVEDKIANLNVKSGYSILSSGSDSLLTNQGTKITIADVHRGTGATLFIRSSTLGSTTPGASTIVTAGNVDDYLIGGGGAEGNSTISIIPWMVANNTSANTGLPTGFVAHVEGKGLRALSTGETSSSITAGATHNVNVSNVALASDATVNSLRTTNTAASNIGAGRVLTVASGGVFFGGNNGTIGGVGSATAGTLNFGSAEGIIYSIQSTGGSPVLHNNIIGAAIAGTGGITKSGVGTLVLTGKNTYTGTTVVAGGKLQVGNGSVNSYLASKWNDNVIVANGGTLQISSDNAIPDGNTLHIDSYGLFNGVVSIDAGRHEVIGGLKIAGVYQPIGTYSAVAGDGVDFVMSKYFAGTGTLEVTALPEPASVGALALGALGLLRRRRR